MKPPGRQPGQHLRAPAAPADRRPRRAPAGHPGPRLPAAGRPATTSTRCCSRPWSGTAGGRSPPGTPRGRPACSPRPSVCGTAGRWPTSRRRRWSRPRPNGWGTPPRADELRIKAELASAGTPRPSPSCAGCWPTIRCGRACGRCSCAPWTAPGGTPRRWRPTGRRETRSPRSSASTPAPNSASCYADTARQGHQPRPVCPGGTTPPATPPLVGAARPPNPRGPVPQAAAGAGLAAGAAAGRYRRLHRPRRAGEAAAATCCRRPGATGDPGGGPIAVVAGGRPGQDHPGRARRPPAPPPVPRRPAVRRPARRDRGRRSCPRDVLARFLRDLGRGRPGHPGGRGRARGQVPDHAGRPPDAGRAGQRARRGPGPAAAAGLRVVRGAGHDAGTGCPTWPAPSWST